MTMGITFKDIDSAITEAFSLSPGMLQRKTTAAYISLPRMVAMALARELTRHSYSKIGAFYGLGSDAARFATKRVPSLAQTDSGLAASVLRAREIIARNGPWMAGVRRDAEPALIVPAAPETSRRLFVVTRVGLRP